MMADYYNILNLTRGATHKEIRQAYRKLARRYHPDVNHGDQAAEEKFKKINEAYEVLSNEDSRKKYNRYGDNWKQAERIEAQYGDGTSVHWTSRRNHSNRPNKGFGDLFGNGFGDLFGNNATSVPKTRVQSQIEITLDEAFAGTKRNITLTKTGQDRRFEIKIPPGVDTGSIIRISPDEEQEVLLKITVKLHRFFKRKGSDLYTDAQIPFDEVALGGEIEIKTLQNKVRMKIPAESQNGQLIRLAGQGMPKQGSKDRGDLYVTLQTKMPKTLTKEERDLFEQLRMLRVQKE